MSSDHILYATGAYEGLDDISSQNQTLGTIREDIESAMNSLHNVYTGQSAQALAAAHAQIESLLDDAQHQLNRLQQAALQQHDTMHALDSRGAAAF
jgi:uncharacterized protein YukE